MRRSIILAALVPVIALFSVPLLLGCGDDSTTTDPPPPPRELRTPELRQVAPTNIAAGQTMTILGSGFEDKVVGETRLSFEGTYQTTSGRSVPVKLEVTPTPVNQGVLTWTFGPNIPFIQGVDQQDTGVFRGVVRVRNLGINGEVKAGPKAARSEQIQVMPSIILRQMRPRDAACAVGITDTVADTKFLFEVQAVGLRSGTKTAPIRFVYTFMKQHFQFRGYFANQIGMDPEGLFPKTGPTSAVEDVTDGNISKLGTGVPRNIYVAQGAYTKSMANMSFGADKTFGLTDLYTAPVPSPAANYYIANMNIVAVDSAGQEAARSVRLRVWVPVEVDYDGGSVMVETFDPVPVSNCIAGGQIGTDVTYSENQAEERERGYTVSASVSGGVDVKVVRLNAQFGIEVNSKVTSSKSKDLKISGKILPGQYGVFYRQTIKLERRAKLIGHGACGSTQDLGDVIVTDWAWSPDLARGPKCPPLPPSNLPPGKKYKKDF